MRVRIVLVLVGLALLFGAAEARATLPAVTTMATAGHHDAEVLATHDTVVAAPVTNTSRQRRLSSVDVVLGALFVLALLLSWPCATRVFRARPIVARFSIRRRGPPLLLAAA